MDVHEALHTTRMMRRLHSDPIHPQVKKHRPRARGGLSQITAGDPGPDPRRRNRAPSRANTQRWHFLAVDDPATKAELATMYRRCRDRVYADIEAGRLAKPVSDPEAHAETMHGITASGDYLVEHFAKIPLVLFAFVFDDQGGANIYPAIWRTLLAARGRSRRHHHHDAAL
ncbi:hypothetical protein [Pseudonocardia alaniniphila]|uniref:Nitroreductase family protein n=1 Tax=Pseudonocardia alaniniphila TaxID=75291 RepID=A0ABS9TV38_9PSEU|nr:hypothetical protein [Pseudonocardia alaniniphila]MCH6172427.1 hypothetical protein [Pseudonocardia alaniniphila]